MSLVRVLAVVSSGLAMLQAQSPQQPTFRTRIDLIQVNVVAVDEAGRHVYGLTAEDFTLLDRGKRQTIATFQEIDTRRSPGQTSMRLPATVRRDVSSNQTADQDRLVILVIDDLHVYRRRTDRAKAIARDVVTKLAPGAMMAVLFTSGERSTEVTDDSSRLMRAVDTLEGRLPLPRPTPAVDAQTPRPLDPEGGLENLDIVSRNQSAKVQDFFDNMTKFTTLEDATRMLRLSEARRKAFVLVTEGIFFNPTGAYDEPASDCPPPGGTCYHWHAVQEMMRSMRRSNIATYVLDPRGQVTSQALLRESHGSPAGLLGSTGGTAKDDDSMFRWDNPVRAAQDGLAMMAEASGGFAVTNDDDFAGGLARIIEDLDHYYLLGFYPAEPDGPQYRPLEVKANRPGLTLRFRRAYAEVGSPEAPKKGADPLGQLVTAALPSSDVPMRLQAIQMPALAKDTRVAFALELTARPDDRTSRASPMLDDIRYGVFVFSLKTGKAVRHFANTAQVLLKDEGAADRPTEAIRFQVLTAFDLPPGEYQVRASATSEALGAGGSVFLPLTVVDSSRRPFDVSDPALGYLAGSRTPTARDKTLTAEDAVRLPLEPSLDREFSADDGVRLVATVARRTPAALRGHVSARNAEGRTVFSEPLDLMPGDDVIDLVLPLSDLAPGPYRLTVSVTDGSRDVERELGFAIRQP